MSKPPLRRWSWLAALLPLLVLAQGSLVCAAPAEPLPAPCTGARQGFGPWGLQAGDQRFIVMMIPHHDGAIAMAELALTRARRPQIRALAQQIKASQTAENAQMRRWYRQWYGTAVPAWTAGGLVSGMGAGMWTGPGMWTGMGPGAWSGMGLGMPAMTTSLDALRTAADFDRAFIEQMVPHHRMGVMMATHAQWNTQHPALRQLEAAMVQAQSQEIAQMEQWYRQWYGASGR